jgi:hypothetical protein
MRTDENVALTTVKTVLAVIGFIMLLLWAVISGILKTK